MKPNFYMLVGLPASGKSSFSERAELQGYVVHSSDALRKELYGDENVQDKNGELFQELHRRIKTDLKNGVNVIFDATNIDRKRRMGFLQELKNIECYKYCWLFATPYEECVLRDSQRERSVGEAVIKRMYLNFQIPQMYEGWDDIKISWVDIDKNSFTLDRLFNGINGLNKIDQDNPHHAYTIGKHCFMCAIELEHIYSRDGLAIPLKMFQAAMFHDIGKRFCKQYKEEKGHHVYYQHHLVSAYESLFYLKNMNHTDKDIFDIVNLIEHHMQPFFIHNDKEKEKFVKLVGEATYDNIMLLHAADKLAQGIQND